jgi:SpoU rRNA methylase family enzyme
MSLLSSLLGGTSSAQTALPLVDPPQSFYALSATDIADQPVSMDRYKGHKVLVVNTASRCGFTPQYAKLEELYQRYAASGLIILGFRRGQLNIILWAAQGSFAAMLRCSTLT